MLVFHPFIFLIYFIDFLLVLLEVFLLALFVTVTRYDWVSIQA